MLDEFGKLGGFNSVCGTMPCTPSESERRERKIKEFAEIAERFAPRKVIVGETQSWRANYEYYRIYFLVEYPVKEEGLEGMRTFEAHLDCGDVGGVTATANSIWCEVPTTVVDAKTLKVIEILH